MLDILSVDALFELLYADELVLMAELIRWKSAFEGKGLKVNFGKTKVMESGSEAVVLAKIDLCGVCGKWAKVNCVKILPLQNYLKLHPSQLTKSLPPHPFSTPTHHTKSPPQLQKKIHFQHQLHPKHTLLHPDHLSHTNEKQYTQK